MANKKTRIFLVAMLTVVLAATFALFGCSGDNEPEEPSNEEQTTEGNESQNQTETVELQIFAANSLSKALDEVQELYSQENEGVTFADTQYKSSGELNELLAAGSSADLLITASKGTMDTAEEKGYVVPSTRIDIFTNDLIIVASEESNLTDVTLQDIADGTYSVAVGDDSVPAGNYAAQALSTLGVYEDPTGETGPDADGKDGDYKGIKPFFDSSVGNVCQHAATGDVDVAIVYSSDVYRFDGVKQVGTIADDTHKTILYPGAICADSENAEAVQSFLDWCISDPEARTIWEKWGFALI